MASDLSWLEFGFVLGRSRQSITEHQVGAVPSSLPPFARGQLLPRSVVFAVVGFPVAQSSWGSSASAVGSTKIMQKCKEHLWKE